MEKNIASHTHQLHAGFGQFVKTTGFATNVMPQSEERKADRSEAFLWPRTVTSNATIELMKKLSEARLSRVHIKIESTQKGQ